MLWWADWCHDATPDDHRRFASGHHDRFDGLHDFGAHRPAAGHLIADTADRLGK
jgi:hypothetical protein